MRQIKPSLFVGIFILLAYLFLFKGVFFQNKILFPSNFLAQFYSPWKSEVFRGWEQGIPHKPTGTDQLRFFYPSRTFTSDELKNGFIPLWNPYIFAGNPHIANFQSSVFFPTTLLFLLLPQITVWNAYVILQPILAILGMILYLRTFKLKDTSVLLGSVCFGLSGFMTVWIYENSVVAQTALLIPFLLWAFEKFLVTRSLRSTLLQIIFLTLIFYAGFFQLAFYIYIFFALYMIVRLFQTGALSFRSIVYIAVVFFTALCLAGPQLMPSLEAYYISARTKSSVWYLFETYLIDPIHFLKLFIPDLQGSPGSYNYFGKGFYHETVLFIGTIPALLAILSLSRFKDRIVLLYLVVVCITVLLVVKSPLTEYFYHLQIPLLSTFVPSRILILTTFALSVLAAFGIEYVSTFRKRVNIGIIAFSFLVLAVPSILGIGLMQKPDMLYPYLHWIFNLKSEWVVSEGTTIFRNSALSIIFAGIFSIIIIFFRKKRFVALVIIVLSAVQLLYFHQKYMTIGEREFLYPQHRALDYIRQNQHFDRTLAIGESIQGNILLNEKIYSADGLDPIFSHNYGVMVNYAKTGSFSEDIPRIEVALSDQAPGEFFQQESLQKLTKILGIKYALYITGEKEPVVPETYKLALSDMKWKLYEVEDRMPRAFFAESASQAGSLRESVFQTLDPSMSVKNIILEEEVPFFEVPNEKDSVQITTYTGERVQINTHNAGQRLLFFSDTYYPGWKAYVNGKSAKIYRADTAFRAVLVPPGSSIIEFKYESKSWYLGLDMLAFGLFMVSVIWYSYSQPKKS